jgi:hypothetical protein
MYDVKLSLLYTVSNEMKMYVDVLHPRVMECIRKLQSILEKWDLLIYLIPT